MAPIIETNRLRLRELTTDDAEFVLQLVNEPSFISNIGDKGIRNLDDAVTFILSGSWTNQKRSGYGQFLIELSGNSQPIGICGLLYRDILGVTDIGYALLSAYHGFGYASEAAAAMMEYGYSTLGIDRIVALTSKENQPSIRVLEKLGLKFERIVKMSDDDSGTALYA
jgi:[ribosomal protein S5]-alanine N-acetyltransferase